MEPVTRSESIEDRNVVDVILIIKFYDVRIHPIRLKEGSALGLEEVKCHS
jgi:hypothetical protein